MVVEGATLLRGAGDVEAYVLDPVDPADSDFPYHGRVTDVNIGNGVDFQALESIAWCHFFDWAAAPLILYRLTRVDDRINQDQLHDFSDLALN